RAPVPVKAKPTAAIDPPVFDPPALRLPVLTSEDLEHFDDSRLDDAYEEKLLVTGDDLRLIDNASAIVAQFAPAVSNGQKPAPVYSNGNGAATAAAIAFDIDAFRNEISPEDAPMELPELGDSPDEELL